MINKCFCTRRNPISISAAAIYLACQLEDKRKTQAEICKVTGLTEVTLRKVYKELLENWDDLLPSNYTPAVPPEKAFPTATISSGRSATPRADIAEGSSLDRDKQPEVNHTKPTDVSEACLQIAGKENTESKDNFGGTYNPAMQQAPAFWKPQAPSGTSMNNSGEKNQNMTREMNIDKPPNSEELEKKVDKDAKPSSTSLWQGQFSSTAVVNASSVSFPSRPPVPMGTPPSVRYAQMPRVTTSGTVDIGTSNQNGSKKIHQNGDS